MSKKFKQVLTLVIALTMALSAVGCKKDTGDNSDSNQIGPVKDPVSVVVTSEKDELKLNEETKLEVVVKNATNTDYKWSVTDVKGRDMMANVEIIDNYLAYTKEVAIDTLVNATATSVEDSTKSGSVSIVLKAKVVSGQVGDLTSEMIEEIANPSITVTGTVNDKRIDVKNNRETNDIYNIKVRMSQDAWQGEWYASNEANKVTDTYCKGTEDVTNNQGIKGKALDKLYIDKDNKPVRRMLISDEHYPSVWNEQHLWNHIGSLNVNRFKTDILNPDSGDYKYTLDVEHNADDAWLSTYLSVSLTPMLMETFTDIYFHLEDHKIMYMYAKTESIYEGMKQDHTFDAVSYTEMKVSFSDMGTTVVSEPVPYEAPQYADKLTNAFNNMKDVNNYTFHEVYRFTFGPTANPEDYPDMNQAPNKNLASTYATTPMPGNNTSKDGEEGVYGQVDLEKDKAVLLAKTGEYSKGTMDGYNFHTEYSGYKQNADNTYDYFEYYSGNGGRQYLGKEVKEGTIANELPTFNLSADIFEFNNRFKKDGNYYYSFILRETAITREVAKQLTYSWDIADSSIDGDFEVVIDELDHVVEVNYNFNMSKTFFGTVRNTYSNFGSTSIHERVFADDVYFPRIAPSAWSDMMVRDYKVNGQSVPTNASVVVKALYDKDVENLPTPKMFRDIFGDQLNGPFYDTHEYKGKEEGHIALNASFIDYDENGYPIQGYKKVMQKIDEVMTSNGFKKNPSNCDENGGDKGISNIYLSYYKGGIEVIFENNHSRNVFIDIYKTGRWKLN